MCARLVTNNSTNFVRNQWILSRVIAAKANSRPRRALISSRCENAGNVDLTRPFTQACHFPPEEFITQVESPSEHWSADRSNVASIFLLRAARAQTGYRSSCVPSTFPPSLATPATSRIASPFRKSLLVSVSCAAFSEEGRTRRTFPRDASPGYEEPRGRRNP